MFQSCPANRCLWGLLLVCALPSAATVLASESIEPAHSRFFEEKVRPLLAAHCLECHDARKQEGELRLDSIEAILKGGESGPAIVPGKPEESALIEAIRYESVEMPPKEQLAADQIAVLEKWIELGAPWPKNAGKTIRIAGAAKITDEDRQWWAFQPIKQIQPPTLVDDWIRNDVDRFVLKRLGESGLQPSDEADRVTLLRRAYFDLIGLPPTPTEVSQFLTDKSPRAYERMIDRLLDSPRYGERWARHWLDLVRYAESDGYKQDAYRPKAYLYRDYVIRSLNADKPYDQFVMEQLAGDELAPNDADAVVATGYLRHWIYEYNQRDVRTQWDTILNDITDVTADVFLGLGMSCARCHDHKFDPILQDDYFRLRAFFAALEPRDDMPIGAHKQLEQYRRRLAEWEQATADIRKQLDEIEEPVYAQSASGAINKFPPDIRPMLNKKAEQRLPMEQQLANLALRQVADSYSKVKMEEKLKGETKERWTKLHKELAKFDHLKPAKLATALGATDIGREAPPTTIPGDADSRDIEPGFVTLLDPNPATISQPSSGVDSTGRRTALARWIASPTNPLSTRVIVNRVWQYHFGSGLVSTSSDFGKLGEPPSHPKLLDWLVNQFVDNGWSLKSLHRLMMTSATYRQSAVRQMSEKERVTDPSNRLLWRANLRRLDAEQIHDALLSASGELQQQLGGPSVESGQLRRAIYKKVIRNRRDPLGDVFDAPDNFTSTSERNTTTTPIQSLFMINNDWILARARSLARGVSKQHPSDQREQVQAAFMACYGRPATEKQLNSALDFLAGQTGSTSTLPTPSNVVTKQAGFRDGALQVGSNGEGQMQLPPSGALPTGDFTVEAVVLLRSLYADATVRTIASHWNSNTKSVGWSFGVTSTKSKYQPRNLILQLIGKQADGKVAYEVIASDLRPELNRPYYVAVTVKVGDTSPDGVRFYMRDLSKPDAELQTASVAHKVISDYRPPQLPLIIGGRAGANRHSWDGLIDEVKISSAVVGVKSLQVSEQPSSENLIGHWKFSDAKSLRADSSSNEHHLLAVGAVEPASPAEMALVDLCHVLLNSSQFLYVD